MITNVSILSDVKNKSMKRMHFQLRTAHILSDFIWLLLFWKKSSTGNWIYLFVVYIRFTEAWYLQITADIRVWSTYKAGNFMISSQTLIYEEIATEQPAWHVTSKELLQIEPKFAKSCDSGNKFNQKNNLQIECIR